MVLGLCFSSLSLSRFLPMSRNDKPDLFSLLDFLPPILGRLFVFSVFSCSGATKVPGPIDFLGALLPLLLKAFGGNWLCLRPRNIGWVCVAAAAIGSDFVEFREVVEALEGLRDIEVGLVLGVAVEGFRVGMGIAAWVVVVVVEVRCAWEGGGSGVSEIGNEPPPGRGKEFRSGFEVVM